MLVASIMKENSNLLINEETLRAIFNNAVDGMVVINNRGIIQSTNLSVTKMFQFTDEEMFGKNIILIGRKKMGLVQM